MDRKWLIASILAGVFVGLLIAFWPLRDTKEKPIVSASLTPYPIFYQVR